MDEGVGVVLLASALVPPETACGIQWASRAWHVSLITSPKDLEDSLNRATQSERSSRSLASSHASRWERGKMLDCRFALW